MDFISVENFELSPLLLYLLPSIPLPSSIPFPLLYPSPHLSPSLLYLLPPPLSPSLLYLLPPLLSPLPPLSPSLLYHLPSIPSSIPAPSSIPSSPLPRVEERRRPLNSHCFTVRLKVLVNPQGHTLKSHCENGIFDLTR